MTRTTVRRWIIGLSRLQCAALAAAFVFLAYVAMALSSRSPDEIAFLLFLTTATSVASAFIFVAFAVAGASRIAGIVAVGLYLLAGALWAVILVPARILDGPVAHSFQETTTLVLLWPTFMFLNDLCSLPFLECATG